MGKGTVWSGLHCNENRAESFTSGHNACFSPEAAFSKTKLQIPLFGRDYSFILRMATLNYQSHLLTFPCFILSRLDRMTIPVLLESRSQLSDKLVAAILFLPGIVHQRALTGIFLWAFLPWTLPPDCCGSRFLTSINLVCPLFLSM